jgi:hypothetical protein
MMIPEQKEEATMQKIPADEAVPATTSSALGIYPFLFLFRIRAPLLLVLQSVFHLRIEKVYPFIHTV